MKSILIFDGVILAGLVALVIAAWGINSYLRAKLEARASAAPESGASHE